MSIEIKFTCTQSNKITDREFIENYIAALYCHYSEERVINVETLRKLSQEIQYKVLLMSRYRNMVRDMVSPHHLDVYLLSADEFWSEFVWCQFSSIFDDIVLAFDLIEKHNYFDTHVFRLAKFIDFRTISIELDESIPKMTFHYVAGLELERLEKLHLVKVSNLIPR